MSRQAVATYRVPPLRPTSGRTLAERFVLRFPRVGNLYRSALLGLPLDSRLRRELLGRVIRSSIEAYNRGDREIFEDAADPDVELIIVGGVAGLDLEDRYRGRKEVMRFWAAIDEAWTSNRLEPKEVIDFGERYLVLMRIRARGRASGAEVEHAIGYLVTWSGGMIPRAVVYWRQDEALEAIGLSG